MEQHIFAVEQNCMIAKDTWIVRLKGDTSHITRPGQFVNVKLKHLFLRRPLSVCDWGESSLTLVYKVVGEGTDYMTRMRPGSQMDILTGLGNGFDLEKSGEDPVLVGGGVGVVPLYGLARRLVEAGRKPRAVLGFNTEDEVICVNWFEQLGVPVTVTTVDGSFGKKGFVTDRLPEKASYTYACGPEPMLKALYSKTDLDGQYSLEARMGCGFGACMGCSCKTKSGYKRVCKEGPVFEKEEILW